MPFTNQAQSDLTTVANAKAYLGLKTSFTDDDALIQRLVTSASAWFEQQVRRTILQASYTDRFLWNLITEFPPHSPPGVKTFGLKNYPVQSVTSVTIDGNALPVAAASNDPGYTQQGDMVEIRGFWNYFQTLLALNSVYYGNREVVIAYSAGFVGVPYDVEQAVIELVSWRYKERDRVGIQSRTVNGETTAFQAYAAPASVNAVIDAYQRVYIP